MEMITSDANGINLDEGKSDYVMDSTKKNSPTSKLERRRRIEELNEERSFKEEWGDY